MMAGLIVSGIIILLLAGLCWFFISERNLITDSSNEYIEALEKMNEALKNHVVSLERVISHQELQIEIQMIWIADLREEDEDGKTISKLLDVFQRREALVKERTTIE